MANDEYIIYKYIVRGDEQDLVDCKKRSWCWCTAHQGSFLCQLHQDLNAIGIRLSISYTCLTFWVLEPPQLLKVGERRLVYLKGNTSTITIIPRNLVSNRFKCAPLDWKNPHRLHTERPKPGGRLAQSSSANQEDGDLCWSCWRHPCSSIALVSAAASQQLQIWMSLCQCLLLRPNILFTLLRCTSSSCVWVWLLGWWQSWLGTPL